MILFRLSVLGITLRFSVSASSIRNATRGLAAPSSRSPAPIAEPSAKPIDTVWQPWISDGSATTAWSPPPGTIIFSAHGN